MAITIYGIKTCDTMKKACAWLDARGIQYAFHDYKTQGIDRSRIEGWCKEHGWTVILNRAGTTFRALPDGQKADLNQSKAIGLMLAQPSMIKRPVLDLESRTLVGFKSGEYDNAILRAG